MKCVFTNNEESDPKYVNLNVNTCDPQIWSVWSTTVKCAIHKYEVCDVQLQSVGLISPQNVIHIHLYHLSVRVLN